MNDIDNAKECVRQIRGYQNEGALMVLQRLVSEGSVTLAELGLTQAEYDSFRKLVDTTCAKECTGQIRAHQNKGALMVLQRLVSGGRVTLAELGLTQAEYDGLHRLIKSRTA